MITDEHFDALRKRREEAEALRLSCIEVTGAAALLHMAFDGGVDLKSAKAEAALLGKLRIIQ